VKWEDVTVRMVGFKSIYSNFVHRVPIFYFQSLLKKGSGNVTSH
jgi:hypothetical protein